MSRCIELQHPEHVAHLQLLSCCIGLASKMVDWLTTLDRLEIPDGAVAGLSAADKSTIEGKLLQLPTENASLFFRGQHLDILKRLRTLLPDVSSGEATFGLFRMHLGICAICVNTVRSNIALSHIFQLSGGCNRPCILAQLQVVLSLSTSCLWPAVFMHPVASLLRKVYQLLCTRSHPKHHNCVLLWSFGCCLHR